MIIHEEPKHIFIRGVYSERIRKGEIQAHLGIVWKRIVIEEKVAVQWLNQALFLSKFVLGGSKEIQKDQQEKK